MANIALLIAGGRGNRMGQDLPKQFLSVDDKPIIMYTCEAFENHPEIDAIVIVCIDGWQTALEAYAHQFNITKLRAIIPGGENGQGSIRNGIHAIDEQFNKDDIVLVHDAIRPMVSADIISRCIADTKRYGSSIVSIPCAEAMLEIDETGENSHNLVNRDSLKRTQTPQGFSLETLLDMHEEASQRGITDSVASCTLAIELGRSVHFTPGSEKNIKLTTVDDIDIFKALLTAKRSSWLKN
ncbi:2-C-methyl-D-erythritol 4-phosphate cytidylyltransferase [Alloscardovia theropitheci]|uniref:2-C-methyl-D-erythritol 4-phosphate cytidylyltransferase n=1 Tax=Alloscardovia theropitheci TaxID=2496842 RepID=A0A4R0QZQ9_9BIFI|nr:IspD/TarI family cytidylyltransferase [Alloscardovia theropitheci]TCD54166.1 2-C-methyl-D-erythritol 4-phosphate cytidylyltransferase [Alloscardovia theropitheci]